ncbi:MULTISPECIES: transporter substrate-binding domain-containing protein [unclassified Leisingera]|uniref:transporter substrate-binding domain-containing protein n=1 Tax=unclassified Leisingera TaxID=2614906 RepID=UPI001012757A|nr:MULTISPECIES: transporter substrate-binding domain-containing protein [unclassified Leisingera]MBQ4823634.1 transporter substrate-binding domain-containing protein [Leisingera sp. HS039]MCF6430923.1 transporter substrate-binding domain-containing protein [Leisingera sp. MMG026]QAX30695.1 transporter substrate-binding domain-containing protein [Leisingera sp. NJS204]QBR37238.1 transporter substrate-binding domain-containing protein [Leisingera sp. NJS201]
MKLKALLAAATAAAALTAGAAAAEQVKIGIAAEPYPPFASLDSSGNWVGWEVEMIGAVCAAAELDCVITPVAWDGIIPSLTGQQIDAIMASMSITEERLKTIDFSDPYYNTPAVIVADKSMDIAPTPDSLAGKIVGIQASTIHQAYAQEYFKDAELKVYQTQDEANQDLFAGRIDATQADSIAMADFVGSDTGSCCEIKGAVADDPAILGRGVGAGVRQGDDALREALNKGIAAVLADGTHEKITAKYFTTSIY